MNLPTIPVPVFSSFFRPGFFIKGMALAGALVTGVPAFSASVQFFDDPEVMQVHYLPDGRVSFAKAGEYSGPLKGQRCNQTAMKDMKHDRVEPVCKPRTKPPVYARPKPETPFVYRPFYRVPNDDRLRSWDDGTWLAGHADAVWGYGDRFYAASDYQIEYVSYFKPAGVSSFPLQQPLVGPVAQVQTPAIPLPASVWMMLAGLAMFWRFK